jgi:hypothetical protein
MISKQHDVVIDLSDTSDTQESTISIAISHEHDVVIDLSDTIPKNLQYQLPSHRCPIITCTVLDEREYTHDFYEAHLSFVA